ncbi:MAG: CHASE2 domain-containing protein [Tepidisphaeraceae bacterium]
MTRLERRVFSRSLVIGALLTLIVLAVHAFGLLDSLEYWLYDQRAIHCQLAEPAPTNRFVHLDIDDASVSPDALGRWPWPRENLARILDEVHRAGPSAVGLDILFSEPQKPQLIQESDGKLRTIDDDAELAQALRKCGNTVLAASFKLESGEAQSAGPSRAVELLAGDLEMTPEELKKHLDWGNEPFTAQALNELFIISRRQAMKARIDGELDRTGDIGRDALFKRLLPHTSPDENSPLRNLFLDQYQVASAERAVYRFGAPRQTLAAPPAEGVFNVVPLARFSNVAAGCAFANYDIFDNATIRAIPLFVEYNRRLYAQMGLATACVMLGADPAAVRFDGDKIVIPAPAGAISIPTYTYHSKVLGRDVPLIAALPWFGGREWETMYDWPNHLNTAAHISIASIWDIYTSERKIAKNSAAIDLAISNILDNDREDKLGVDPSLAKKYAAALPDPQDTLAREKWAAETLDDLNGAGWLDYFAHHSDKELSPEERLQKILLNDAVSALKYTLTQSHQLRIQIDTQRRWLASQIGGKGVLIGFTATGFQDQVSTSLHLHCPGVVVHGVIVNAVLTGHWWRMAPAWVTVLLTILFGMAAAVVQGRLQPLRASFLVLLLLLGYALFNGYILFDWHKWIVGLAGPSVAMLTVWAGCTLDRLIIENVERNRVAIEVAVISKEMDLARQVQVALIPAKAPKIVGLEATAGSPSFWPMPPVTVLPRPWWSPRSARFAGRFANLNRIPRVCSTASTAGSPTISNPTGSSPRFSASSAPMEFSIGPAPDMAPCTGAPAPAPKCSPSTPPACPWAFNPIVSSIRPSPAWCSPPAARSSFSATESSKPTLPTAKCSASNASRKSWKEPLANRSRQSSPLFAPPCSNGRRSSNPTTIKPSWLCGGCDFLYFNVERCKCRTACENLSHVRRIA